MDKNRQFELLKLLKSQAEPVHLVKEQMKKHRLYYFKIQLDIIFNLLNRKIKKFTSKFFPEYESKLRLFYGRDFYGYNNDLFFNTLSLFNSLGSDEFVLTKFLIKNFRDDDVFYDIGANYGFYTLLAQELIKNGEIHSFEPNPKIFPLLEKNAKLEFYNNTYLNNIAVSNLDGNSNFYTFKNSSGYSSVIFNSSNKNDEVFNVKTTTLDTYILDHRPPTIIKIDVEGAEQLVLEGAINVVKTHKPNIVMEVYKDDLHKNAVDILIKNDYEVYYLDANGNPVLMHSPLYNIFEDDVDEIGSNLLFKPKY
ncbi:MAG: FkbM family methyltransferase [Candidatus Micrarchaeaceae archaeon]